MLLHPAAEIQYGRLGRGEIDKRVSLQDKQNIQIVLQFPVHFVCAGVRGHVGGIDKEHDVRRPAVFVRQHLVIATDHFKAVKIPPAAVVGKAQIVIEALLPELLQVQGVFPGNSREDERVM